MYLMIIFGYLCLNCYNCSLIGQSVFRSPPLVCSVQPNLLNSAFSMVPTCLLLTHTSMYHFSASGPTQAHPEECPLPPSPDRLLRQILSSLFTPLFFPIKTVSHPSTTMLAFLNPPFLSLQHKSKA